MKKNTPRIFISMALISQLLIFSVVMMDKKSVYEVNAQEKTVQLPEDEYLIEQEAIRQIVQVPSLIKAEYTPFNLGDIHFDDSGWVIFNMLSYPLNISEDSEMSIPRIILGLAKRGDDTTWEVHLDFSEDFSSQLENLPKRFLRLTNGEKTPPEFSNYDVLADVRYQIPGLPWPQGTAWRYNQGVHGGAQEALDFGVPIAGQADWVHFADSGTVVYKKETCIAVQRSDKLRLWYQHIRTEDIEQFTIGDSVKLGQRLGMTTLESGCDGYTYGHHLHFYWDFQGQAVPAEGTSLNGWVVVGNQLHKNGVIAEPNMQDLILHSQDDDISPAMTSFNNLLLLSYRDEDNKIQTEIYEEGVGWKIAPYSGGSTGGEVSMTVYGDRVYQAVRGLDNKIYTRWSLDGFTWSDWLWINESGSTNGNISMIVYKGGLYQTVRGINNQIFIRTTGDGNSWTSWASTDSSDFYAKGDVSSSIFNDMLYQAVRGQNDRIYTRSTSDGVNWSGWIQINNSGSAIGDVMMETFSGGLYQAVCGMNNKIYTRQTFDGSNWSAWASPGTLDCNGEVSMTTFGKRLYQSVSGLDRKIYTRYSSDGVTWSNWRWINNSGSTTNSIISYGFKDRLFQSVYGLNDVVYVRSARLDALDTWTPWLLRTQIYFAKLTSTGSLDGYILEKSEFSNQGGSVNSNAKIIYVGDSTLDRQYRAVLSFDTAALPDNAVVTAVILKLKHGGIIGTNPFTTHGKLLVDIRKGWFSDNRFLQVEDFGGQATQNNVMSFSKTMVQGWYSSSMSSSGFAGINLGEITQFRLRFQKEDNDDYAADYLKIHSGDSSSESRPVLLIEYYVR